MDAHDGDATGKGETWDQVGAEFAGLRRRIKEVYNRVADGSGPTDEEVSEAFATLAAAWNQVAATMTTAFNDPEVRERVRSAAVSLASAFGAALSELGSELKGAAAGSEEE